MIYSLDMEGTRVCRTCLVDKPITNFHANNQCKGGRTGICAKCTSRRACWHALKVKYGITMEQFNKMFEEQNGCCKICKSHQSELKKTLCVDHDHVTGKVRGLLCDPCNNGLGRFKDDIDHLNSAILYLKGGT